MQATAHTIDEAASEWVARIDRGLDRQEERALQDWLASDARCREALDLAQGVWKNLDRAQVFKIAAEQNQQPARPRRSLKPLAYAAAALLAVAMAATGMRYSRTHVSTRTGEIRQVPLADGSRVTLDTRTRIALDYGDHSRLVRLDAGAALFEVAKDPTRPFVVRAGAVQVRAIGTAFVVRRNSDTDVQVTVTKGAVDVWSNNRPGGSVVRLKAGSETSLVGGATMAPPRDLTPAQIARVTEWKSGTLDLDGMTLGQAAAQINRYNIRQVVIPDSRLAAQTLIGHVNTSDPLAFAQATAAMLDASVRTDGDQIFLEPSSAALKK